MEFNYLNDKDLMYYSRHILLPNIGIEGQQKLNLAEVTIFGLGGLGNLLFQTFLAHQQLMLFMSVILSTLAAIKTSMHMRSNAT